MSEPSLANSGGIPMSIKVGRSSLAMESQTLKVGDLAPDFHLPSHRSDEKIRLSDYKGKSNVVIVFYPLDWTPV